MQLRLSTKAGSTMKFSQGKIRLQSIAIALVAMTLVIPQSASIAVNAPTTATPNSATSLLAKSLAVLPTGAKMVGVPMGTNSPYTPTTAVPDYFGTADSVSGYATGNFANSPLPISVLIQGSGVGAFYTAESDWNPTTKTGGQITRFIPINQGTGYGPGTIVTVIGGGGNGAQGTPHFDPTTGAITSVDVFKPGTLYGSVSGIRKFVQDLPDLATAKPTALPAIGIAGTPTYIPASDGYEIATIRSKWQFSKDLPFTTINMYVQIDPACNLSTSIPLTYPDGTPIHNGAGAQVCAFQTNFDAATKNIAPFSYLGPTIVAQKDRPVRVTFDNYLPTGTGDCTTAGGMIDNTKGKVCGGDLFLPVDPTIMGAGDGPNGGFYSTNRSTIHLHGGVTPWISDGTMDQWVTPVGSNEQYPQGVSVRYVPDMWYQANGTSIDACYGYTYCFYKSGSPFVGSNTATPPTGYAINAAKATTNPGQGRMTFYYTNQQSARMMWYHDHSSGTTRLNVYSGEAAAYMLHDAEEGKLMVAAGVRPASAPDTVNPDQEKVLVIQDRTFVPSPSQLALQDPTWNTKAWGTTGSLWFPHVYQPNQNPALLPTNATITTATVASGGGVTSNSVTIAALNSAIKVGQVMAGPAGLVAGTVVTGITGTTISFSPAATSQLSGIISFGNAASSSPGATPTGRWDYGPWFWPASTATMNGPVPNPRCNPTCPGIQNSTNPGVPNVSAVPEAFTDVMTVNGIAYPVAKFKPQVYRLQLLNASNDRSLILNLYYAKSSSINPNAHCTGSLWANVNTSKTVNCGDAGEVSLLAPIPGSPGLTSLTAPDQIQDHAAGVPDMRLAGPDLVEFSSEGGILPDLYNIPTTPVGYEFSRQSIVTGNVKQHGLILGPAQRAEVLVDLSAVPSGSTLILYNDGPAPFPGFDPRFDYYTGAADQTINGGAPSPLAGYAPNTRTIMQIQVNGTAGAALDQNAVTTALHADYLASQDAPVVPQVDYNAALNTTTAINTYPTLADSSLTVPSTGVASIAVDPTKVGTHTGVPTVRITGGNGNGARAIAQVTSTSQVASVAVTTPAGTVYDAANLANVHVSVSAPASGGRTAVLVPSIEGAGQLANVAVVNPGSGYTSAPTVTVSGAATTAAVVQAQLVPTSIAEIQVAGGGLYTRTPKVTISGGGSASTQNAIATLQPSPIASINVVNGGSYTVAPTLTVLPAMGNATATAVLAGSVGQVTVSNAGSCTLTGATTLDPNTAYFMVSFSGGGQTTSAQAVANVNTSVLGSNLNVSLRSITLLSGGSYSSNPIVTIIPVGFNSCAVAPVATSELSASSHIASVLVTATGSFTTTPTVVADTGSATFAVDLQPTSVASVNIIGTPVSDFTDAPLVTFDGAGNGIATAFLVPSAIDKFVVLDRGSGYKAPPTLTVAAPVALPVIPMGMAAVNAVTAVAAPASATGNLALTIVDPGTGYASAPTVTISGGTTDPAATAATAVTTLGSGKVTGIQVTNPGSGYLTAPTVTLTYPDGSTDSISSTATLSTQNVVLGFQSKGVQEAFEIMYGRMNAMMNSEIPATTWVNQTSVTWASVDSPTEVINTNSSELTTAGGQAVGTLPDGTQIWRFTHNGVDTHFLHFHMFNVQVVSRMQWDGINQPLTGDDLGWRDTVSIDQLTVLFVAIKPIVPIVPWSLPNSIRPLSPTETLGMPGMMMSAADPLNNNITQNNQLVNFGWEYMIHCHLLGHEENDMMRSVAVGVVLNAPSNVVATKVTATTVRINWVDNSNNETGFIVQRSADNGATWVSLSTARGGARGGVITSTVSRATPTWNTSSQKVTDNGLSTGTTESYTDTVPAAGSYQYRVLATDLIGTPNLGAFPTENIASDPSNTAYVTL